MTSKYDDTFLVKTVKDAYSSIAKTGSTVEYASQVAQSFGYSVEQLKSIPDDAHMGLGCGNPTVTATLKPGETVVDLGSGGGIDIFLSSSKVGPDGKAIGLDMSPDMVKRARENAKKRGLFPPQVSFIECSLTERLPIESNSVDCVLSNCVINLLPQSGKNDIFKEIHRILKPGGRVVLDDILAKQELPPHIRDDLTQYVSCIGGAIQRQEYNAFLEVAGFKDSLFVDNRADLNVYLMAAELEAPSCCGSAAVQAKIPNATGLDLNSWAASFQIYARKPDQPNEPICEEPLTRWWDAYPSVQATDIARILPAELARMLRNGDRVSVVDVRGDDRTGGHVKGSYNIRAQTFHKQLSAFHEKVAGMPSVVFYCGSSQGRGPRCAGWYQDFLDGNKISVPKIFVLDGGFKRWLEEFSGDSDLTTYS
ncbi:S-adenosyl-L-methionine-dependent methyltransferase [Mycena sp. CBHHK59/15]|nr:S-adenosyl-L-methionine-dependent methyltransferase [Mycena sp. CBHHK59/15]